MLATTGGGLLAAEGTVEFRAHSVVDRAAGTQHENSRFVREDGQWRYLDGVSLAWSCSTPSDPRGTSGARRAPTPATTGSVFAPQTTVTTRSPAAGT